MSALPTYLFLSSMKQRVLQSSIVLTLCFLFFGWHPLEPGMARQFDRGGSLARVLGKSQSDEVLHFWALALPHGGVHVHVIVANRRVDLVLSVSEERQPSTQHRVDDHASTPNVDF